MTDETKDTDPVKKKTFAEMTSDERLKVLLKQFGKQPTANRPTGGRLPPWMKGRTR